MAIAYIALALRRAVKKSASMSLWTDFMAQTKLQHKLTEVHSVIILLIQGGPKTAQTSLYHTDATVQHKIKRISPKCC